jgi:hypothetical protein
MAPFLDDSFPRDADRVAGPSPASPAQPGFPIAIIGISCKFAGGVTSPEKLWELCAQGGNAWSKVPKSRFNHDSFYDADMGKPAMVSSAHIFARATFEGEREKKSGLPFDESPRQLPKAATSLRTTYRSSMPHFSIFQRTLPVLVLPETLPCGYRLTRP